MEDASVVLAVPHTGNWAGYFVDTVLALRKAQRSSLIRVENKPVDVARNMLARGFLENPTATHIFFMDSDQIFPVDALERLLSRGKDVIGGTYFARTENPIPHVYEFGRDNPETGARYYRSMCKEFAAWTKAHPEVYGSPKANVFPDTPDSLIRCDALAAGCLLVSRRVFETIPFPWFECWPQSAAGEEFGFCQKARDYGFEVWADFSVQCAHEIKLVFQGATDFIEVFGIGQPDEQDFERPSYVEAGPGGKLVRLGVKAEEFELPDVEGYLTDEQGRLLDRFAKRVPEDGLIVELGSYKGKSTIALARSGRRVYTVDHFAGEPADELDDPIHGHTDHMNGNYREDLEANLARYGVADNVLSFLNGL